MEATNMNFKVTVLASGKTEFFRTYEQAESWADARYGRMSYRIEEVR
jgi:hypothetical protein